MNISAVTQIIQNKLSPTAKLKLFGLMQIPLLFAVNPKVLKLDENQCEVHIPLNYITRNHLNSMYFGALAIGADAVVAILALNIADQYKNEAQIVPVFKDLKADFLKRADEDVVFVCDAGVTIKEMVLKAIQSGERVTGPIAVTAYSKSDRSVEFAKFTLGLSLKAKK